MKKMKLFSVITMVVVMVVGIGLISCSSPLGVGGGAGNAPSEDIPKTGIDSNNEWDNEVKGGLLEETKTQAGLKVIDNLNLGRITRPSVGRNSITELGSRVPQYTGTVAWVTSDGDPLVGPFQSGTVYQAIATLQAKPGWTFEGVKQDTFYHNDAESITNPAGLDDVNMIVTIVFEKTPGETVGPGEPGEPPVLVDKVVTIFNLNDIKQPETRAMPDTSELTTAQWTAEVEWFTMEDDKVSLLFQPDVVYKAVVTFIAKEGWTFDGVAANAFDHSHDKATSIDFEVGETAVTLVFPATKADPVKTFDLTGRIRSGTDVLTTPAYNGTRPDTFTSSEDYTGTIAWSPNDARFKSVTDYTATLTLTKTQGYTFAGVTGPFIYTGALSVSLTVVDKDTATVTIVFPKTGLPPLSITSNPATLSVQETTKLVTSDTENPITWSSSDETIAIVDSNGKVTVVGVGNKLGDQTYTWSITSGTHFALGKITEAKVTSSAAGWGQYSTSGATGDTSVTITATRPLDGSTATKVINVSTKTKGTLTGLTTAGQGLKDRFAPYFLIGNIETGGTGNAWYKNNFNIVTHENGMKPGSVGGSISTSTGTVTGVSTSSKITTITNAGYKMHAHVLYWHDQNASWASTSNFTTIYNNLGTAGIVNAMNTYAELYAGGSNKGKIYSIDVLNEVLYDDNDWSTPAQADAATWQQACKQGAWASSWYGKYGNNGSSWSAPAGFPTNLNNTWVSAIGPEDAIYYMFLSVRKADPGALLVINDFNTELPNKRRWYHDMITYINNRYRNTPSDFVARPQYANGSSTPLNPNNLIDVLGWQEHHNMAHMLDDQRYPPQAYITANRGNLRNTSVLSQFDTYRDLGIYMDVSELDVEAYTSAQRGTASAVSYTNILRQADYYYKLFKMYLLNHDILDHVTWWGSTGSWRSTGDPLPWSCNSTAGLKPAYYGVLRALEEYEEACEKAGKKLLATDPEGRAWYNPNLDNDYNTSTQYYWKGVSR